MPKSLERGNLLGDRTEQPIGRGEGVLVKSDAWIGGHVREGDQAGLVTEVSENSYCHAVIFVS